VSTIGLTRMKRETAAQSARAREQNGARRLLSEDAFADEICRERKRAERSGRSFALMLVERDAKFGRSAANAGDLLVAVANQIRETDVVGWHRQGLVAGAILNEFGDAVMADALNSIRLRVCAGLLREFSDLDGNLRIAFHIFPDQWDVSPRQHAADSSLYPDLYLRARHGDQKGVKRALDIAGSLAALVLLSPLFALIALAVRITSKGPAFFRQERIGQFGRAFTMYKFRSMTSKADPDRHRKFVEEFISGKMDSAGSTGLYKMTDDPRITPLGKFLRRTSLDELPQLFNVLRGEMSLVGPRPPLLYEVEAYEPWHRRRLLEAKPGLTGLWQVSGRSQTKFNDMVRLDLRYARMQTLWIDLTLILKTLRVLVADKGAC
jgi:lipopolysaccharide/colanic/teichoic acid biosynthesis glycosyltransferase